jgi:phage terminase small subunit
MCALSNHRRELFAQLLVQGFTAVDAHEKAGLKRHDGNASVLARHPEIEARIMEIKGELMEPKVSSRRGRWRSEQVSLLPKLTSPQKA